MGAKNWQPEAAQLVSEANRGRQKLETQRFSLSLSDFKPNSEVAGVLTKHSDLLSSLSDLYADKARESSAQLKELFGNLSFLADSIQDRLVPHSRKLVNLREQRGAENGDSGAAANEDLQVAKGKDPGTVEDQGAEPIGDKTAEEEKARRILWYNWFFVACLIVFIKTRLPPRGLGIKSYRSANAAPVANQVVNRAFRTYGASAFYVLDAYSAMHYMLSGFVDLWAKSQDIAEEAFTCFSRDYTQFFPTGGTKLVYFPALLIASITNHTCVDVCYAIGLGEVGARLRGAPLQRLRDDVGMCMAVPASLMADILFDAEPLRPSALDPGFAAIFNSLPPGSFDLLASARNFRI